MLFSIITASSNSKDTIRATIESVLGQSYGEIEYLIIDNCSTDGTLDIVKQYQDKRIRIVSEKDNGIYHALNKGIKLASGDIVAFLNSDDTYYNNNIIKKFAEVFTNNPGTESCYGDLVYVSRKDNNKVIRFWKSGEFDYSLLACGWMVPHPTFCVRKRVYDKYGVFNLEFKIASDYEIILRFLYKYKLSTYYINETLIKMSMGGNSNRSLWHIFRKSCEDYKIMRIYGISPVSLIRKNLNKVRQFYGNSGRLSNG
ncbi:MAG: glycosyltransferase family 2 protein [Candidatus Omnitrophica bacterium]|nr:glycosyltransferase family 2 protein [Candidatus Omnitrophota bacterium]MDD5652834.1 glycosyltransferase family 2 protein [Candidatus Omnitrophota bacterium]